MTVYGCMHLKELVALFHKSMESLGAMIALSLITPNMYIQTYTRILYIYTLVGRWKSWSQLMFIVQYYTEVK